MPGGSAAVADVLGGQRTLKMRIRTTAELAAAVEAGLPVASLDIVVRRVTEDTRRAIELKHRIVPKTTLQRRRDRLSTEESERLERLARLTALAEQVWEEPGLAHEFLVSPQPQLDGERPVDLIRTDLGTRTVEDLLWSLEYSLPV
ncbi:MAG TPA: antitoxin Xre/MbcA/ParS toxin-binding domain-containing protein [Acidimicrobiia bacterium]|jgi:putative toxin-antitoxin system antitoxin component (TIGR02293 family)